MSVGTLLIAGFGIKRLQANGFETDVGQVFGVLFGAVFRNPEDVIPHDVIRPFTFMSNGGVHHLIDRIFGMGKDGHGFGKKFLE